MRWLVLLLALLTDPALAQAPEQRVALVIGNAAYKSAPLRNPLNDARAMQTSLRELGFSVIAVENGSRKAMQQGLRQFRDKLAEDAVGLFYYSGHGMQVKGINFLIPVDAEIRSEAEVEEEAVNLNGLLARLDEARNRLNIVILDACRDNPFERSFRSGTRGLGQVDAPAGTLIAYATAPGRTAADGTGSNGLYTSALLKAMREPGLQVEEVFKRVRAEVQAASKREQVPWEASSLTGNFQFRPGAPPPPAPVAMPAAPAAPAPVPAAPPAATPVSAAPTVVAAAQPPRALGANPHDGRWEGKYSCGPTRFGDPGFERTLRIALLDGRTEFGRSDNYGSPGTWLARLEIDASGAVDVTGEGYAGGRSPTVGQAYQIRLRGKTDGTAASAYGQQGARDCSLTLTRR